MKDSFRLIILNILGCLFFLSIPVISSPDIVSFRELIFVGGFQRNFLSFFFLMIFFYVNYYFLIPKIYFKKKYAIYGVSLLLGYIVVNYVPAFLIHEQFRDLPHFRPFKIHPNAPPPMDLSNVYFFHAKSLVQFLAAFFLSLLLRINQQLQETQDKKLKAEVSYLKAQINPHFLFNTLNSLYALTIEKSDSAPDAVIKLSNMMRYVVSESTNDFVSLEHEINYINDYIELQRLRISEQNNLEFTVVGNPVGKTIAPLVVIPFIENAFKYGVNSEEMWHISIKMEITEFDFILEVKNSKVAVNLVQQDESKKGIENTSKRLRLIYPHQHELTITDTSTQFEVYLKINLV
ncbi:sensor histidine kinase [Flavobacterium sp. SM2513]|uniref:sensor histidine kinase n=1 Tax=Flavobacterium sp. SM2513 TaxID=3424766 RepID=UPI003D7F5341